MKSISKIVFAVGLALPATLLATSSRSDVAPVAKRPFQAPVVLGPAPSNDDCANATPIPSVPFSSTVDTTGATLEPGEPDSVCTITGGTIWYSYTNTSGNVQSVATNTFGSDPMDTVLETFTGSCAALVPLGCNDDDTASPGGLQSSLSFLVDPGQTILIRAGGFDGETGDLTFDVTEVQDFGCGTIDIGGTLGSGSPDWPSVSGTQTGRLNRNGISSTCAAPKTCLPFDATPGRAFDAYTVPNDSGADQCVNVTLEVITQAACNLQVNSYLGTYDPVNLCTNYLADPGLSSGTPPTPVSFSYVQPTGQDSVLVVHTTNPGEIGCEYNLTVLSNLCAPDVDIALTKSVSPTTVTVGDPATFMLTVTNNGPGDATNVVVTDVLPAGLTYSSNDCGATVVAPNVTWNVGALASGASAICNVTVSADQPGTFVNNAAAVADGVDPVPANNGAVATLSVGDDTSILEIPTLSTVGLAFLVLGLAGLALRRVRVRN